MSAPGCAREPEVLTLLRAGHWPAGCEDELRSHVASCPSCRDLLEVATALLEEKDAMLAAGPQATSGLVWWRMQMRLEEEAARSARRMLLLVQGLCVSIGGGFALAMLHLFVPDWPRRIAGVLPLHSLTLASVTAVGTPLVLLGLIAWLTLGSMAGHRARD